MPNTVPNTHRLTPRIHWGMLAIALPLLLTVAAPAEANFIQTIRGLLSGDTGGAARGRSRGGAIRDQACTVKPGAAAADRQTSAQLVALVPTTIATTTQAVPSMIVNVPFERDVHNMVLVFELAEKETATARRLVAEPVTLSLPEQPGLVQFQFPETVPLQLGKTYEWTFRLLCQGPDSAAAVALSFPQTRAIPADQVQAIDIDDIDILTFGNLARTADDVAYPNVAVRQEVFGQIRRVDESGELQAALQRGDRHQAYANENIWFDMVAALAATSSPDWPILLEAFDLAESEVEVRSLEAASESF